MAGIGDAWGTREELLHPRGKNGRFIKKLKTAVGIVDMIQRIMADFSRTLRTFPNDQQAAQYAFNRAKPGRFGGGSDLPRFKADFDNVQEDLRDGVIDDPSTKRYVAMMDASAIELPDSLIVSRVVPASSFGLTPEQMDADEGGIRDWQGSLIADRGYSPTVIGTPHPAPAGPGMVTMRIAVPKGTKAIPVGDGPNDRELILDRDQEYQVTKVTPDGRGGWYMSVVATPRTPGETPPPETGHVGPGKPSDREAQITRLRETRQKQMAVPEEPAPAATPAPAQAAPAPAQTPGVPPANEAPAARKARRQQILAQGQQPGTAPPAPAAAPAPAAPGAPEAPATPAGPVDIKAAVAEAGLPSPSAGKRRAAWNNAYLGLKAGKKDPADLLRELESDIDYWEHVLEDDRRSDTDPGPLPDDIDALHQLRDLIKEKYGLAGREGQKPAPEAPPAPTPEAPETPAVAKKTAPKATVPKKAGPREVEPPTSKEGRERIGKQSHVTPVKKETGAPRAVEEETPRKGREPVGKGHAKVVKREPGFPREVAEPADKRKREQLGQGHVTPVKKVTVGEAPPPKKAEPPKKVNVSKEGREETQSALETLRETVAGMPEGSPTRERSQKLLDQMEEDFQDDAVVADWVKGSGVREASLTERERAEVAAVARDLRTGKIDPAEAGRMLRSSGNEKLAKIARRAEGGAAVRTPRKKKERLDELDDMLLVELRKTAKEEGLKGYSKLKKDELKKAIRDKRGGVEAPKKAVPAGPPLKRMPALTPDQRREFTDLSPEEQKEYRQLRLERQGHEDALQGARDLVGERNAEQAGRDIEALEVAKKAALSKVAKFRAAQAEGRARTDEAIAREVGADTVKARELFGPWLRAAGVEEADLSDVDKTLLVLTALGVQDKKISRPEAMRRLQRTESPQLNRVGEAIPSLGFPRAKPVKKTAAPQLSTKERQAESKRIRDKRGGVGAPEAGPLTKAGALSELDDPTTTMARMREIAKEFDIKPKGRTKDAVRADVKSQLNVTESGRPEAGSPDAIRAAKKAVPAKKAAPSAAPDVRRQTMDALRDADINRGLPASDFDPDVLRELDSQRVVDLMRPVTIQGLPIDSRAEDPTAEGVRVHLTPIGRVMAEHPDWSDDQVDKEVARRNRARIQEGREKQALSGLLGRLDESFNNGGSKRAMLHTVNSPQFKVPDDVRQRLRTAVESESPDKIRAALASEMQRGSLTPIGGQAEDVVPFDPRSMDAIGKRPPAGQPVRVVRPGHMARMADGREVMAERASVQFEGESPPAVSREDRVTRLLMDRVTERDPAMRDRVMENMDPADRELVRESIARAGGTPPPVTDAEVKSIREQIEEELGKLRNVSPEDIQESARIIGLDPLKGETSKELIDDAFRQLVQRELDKRVAAKAAKKVAPKKAAPRPADAFEGLDVKEIGKGLDLDLIPQGHREWVQEDLDAGKMTPAAIGRQLEKTAQGPAGPFYQAAVVQGVTITGARDRLKELGTDRPSPENDPEVAMLMARISEAEAEVAQLRAQGEEMMKLAARLKVTRRKRVTAPKPVEPTLTPKEEARAAEVADLAGVPETKVQARMKERKQAAARPSDYGQGVVDLLRTTQTREEADALLRDRLKVELVDIAKAAGIPVLSTYGKDRIKHDIIEQLVGSRLDSAAIRGMIQETGMGFGTPSAQVPAKTPAEAVQRMNDFEFENPRSREETGQIIAGFSKVQLVETARLLGIPAPEKLKKEVLHQEIVNATVGHRLDSIATRGFRGVRPGEGGLPGRPPAALPKPKATAAERLRPLNLRPPKGKPGESASASALGPGDRVMVIQNADGKWERTSRRTGSKPVTITRVDRTVAGQRQQSKYVFRGIDDDGNDVTMEAVFGQNTFTRAPLRERPSTAAKKAAVAQLDLDNPHLASDRLSQDIIWGLTEGGDTPEDIIEGLIEDGIAEPQARGYVQEIQDLLKHRAAKRAAERG